MVAESVRLVQEEAPEILPREESEDDHPQLHRRRPSRRPPAQIRPWSIPRRLPPWFATLPPGVFTDPEGVSKALERLTDITDVLYVASDPRSKDAATREVYGAMLSNRSILFVVVPNCCKPVLVRLHAILSNQSVALVVGATGIGILPLGDDPGVPWKVYAISGHPLPSGIFHGPFDRADSEDVAKAKPLTDITRVLYIAWDPRPTDAAAREANCDMLSNSSELPQICPRLYFGMLRHSSPNSTGTGYIQREHLNIMNKTKEYGFFGLQNKVYSYQQLARRIPKELSMSFEFRQPKYLPAKSGGDCSNPKITNDVGQDAGKRQRKVGQVSHMTWRQTRRVILLVLILGNFMSKVNAVAETHMCPVRTIVDVLPAKSCPVILSTSDYWFHSKRTARGGTHHNTSCNVYKDWFVMLATASPCQVVWTLDQIEEVKFFAYKRRLISVWIYTLMASIFYCGAWILYGHLLAQSKDEEELGKHILSAYSKICLILVGILLMLFSRHLKARSTAFYLLVLVCVIMPLYILKDMEANEDNVFRVGLIGFSAMVMMYVFKFFTITGLKKITTGINAIIIFFCLYCENPELTTSWYGCAFTGSFCFRIVDIARSFYMMSSTQKNAAQEQLRSLCRCSCQLWRVAAEVLRIRRSQG